MAKSPLILAALAKDAVPHLDFVQAMPLSLGHEGNFDSAVLTASDGNHFVIRQANNAEAELQLDTEAVVLRALTPFRSHFPFEITKQVGETRDSRGKRALLYSYVYGSPVAFENRPGTSPLAGSVANALAAIHSLPISVVENNGLPVYSTDQVIRELTAEMDRFAQTGRIPATLLNRWERALEDVNVWRFQPAVIHGNLNLDNLLELDDGISGVLGWHSLRVGDPALDFAVVQGAASDDFSYSSLLEYESIKGADQNFRARAQLYSEFDIARYLMWSLAHSAEELPNAEKYLETLVSDIEGGLIMPLGPKPLGVDAELTSAASYIDTASGFMDASQAIVSDNLLTQPGSDVPIAVAYEFEEHSASAFTPIVDSSYNHKNLFGETGPIPTAFDATAPIPVVSGEADLEPMEEVTDKTVPIALPVIDDTQDAEAEPGSKPGELF